MRHSADCALQVNLTEIGRDYYERCTQILVEVDEADRIASALQLTPRGRLRVALLPEYRPVEFAINAIYPHRRYLATTVRTFIDLLVERFVQHQRWIEPLDTKVSSAG